jgi:endonuclease YncB( thermonuclease family)
VLVAIAVIAGLVALLAPETTLTGRAYAVDGDTIRIGGTNIRLTGFDAVELDQLCTRDGKDWPCGGEARDYMAGLLRNGDATCLSEGRDRYRRELARCDVRGRDLGDAMVRAGWAVADMQYALALAEARLERRGIWAGRFDDPAEWRRTRGEPEPDFWSWLRGLFALD